MAPVILKTGMRSLKNIYVPLICKCIFDSFVSPVWIGDGGMLLPICSRGNQLGLKQHSYPCAVYVNIYPVCRHLLDAKSEAWLGKWHDKHWWRRKITPWIRFTVDNWFQLSSMFYVFCVLLLNAYYLPKAWPIAKKKHSKRLSWKRNNRIILRLELYWLCCP